MSEGCFIITPDNWEEWADEEEQEERTPDPSCDEYYEAKYQAMLHEDDVWRRERREESKVSVPKVIRRESWVPPLKLNQAVSHMLRNQRGPRLHRHKQKK